MLCTLTNQILLSSYIYNLIYLGFWLTFGSNNLQTKRRQIQAMPSRPISQNPKPTTPLKSKAFFIAITASATAIIICTLIYILYHFWQSLFQRSRTSPFDSITSLKHLHKFTYKEIKSATNSFNLDNAIGKGGSGTVFRGVLKDGKSVAVKKLDPSATLQFEKEFQNELNILGLIKSAHVVSLLGYCTHKNKRILVYEYMPNRSLQELLFSEGSLGLNLVSWDRRFQIILDVCRALEFLHNECDPPVIHGDVKPSNVLLDWDFRAKISDFGLSRFKLDGGDQFGVEMFSQDLGLGKSQEFPWNTSAETPVSGARTPVLAKESTSPSKFDFAVALQASSSKNGDFTTKISLSPKGKEALRIGGVSEEEIDDNNSNQWGKDWWWKQDGSGELCSKDYVMEWIGSQISPQTTRDWDEEHKVGLELDPEVISLDKPSNDLDEGESRKTTTKSVVKKEPKKMEDWWREENLEEINNKKRSNIKRSYKPLQFHLSRCFRIRKRRKCLKTNQPNYEQGAEPGSRRIWRKKKKKSSSLNSDMWSGDLFSRELSSTTSMRGTLCYVAPEFGGTGFGFLMEKTDIYSLGVLILVIVSGRRPLHVLNSPMKLEKANLISWCRQLAQAGSVLELVDEKLKGLFNKDQATLCVNLALACLNRMPELRPDVGDIVRILKGEMDLPPLPFEFSPSPPCKMSSKSRSKTQKSCME